MHFRKRDSRIGWISGVFLIGYQLREKPIFLLPRHSSSDVLKQVLFYVDVLESRRKVEFLFLGLHDGRSWRGDWVIWVGALARKIDLKGEGLIYRAGKE